MKSLKKKSFKQRLCLAYSTLNTTKRKIENKRKTWLPHFQKKKQVCCCPTNGARASRLTSERIALVLYILTVFAVQPVTYPTTTPTTTTRLSAAVQVSSSCAVAAVAFKPPKKRTEKRRTLFKFNVALLTIIRTFTFLLICCWLTFCIAQKRRKKNKKKKNIETNAWLLSQQSSAAWSSTLQLPGITLSCEPALWRISQPSSPPCSS